MINAIGPKSFGNQAQRRINIKGLINLEDIALKSYQNQDTIIQTMKTVHRNTVDQLWQISAENRQQKLYMDSMWKFG